MRNILVTGVAGFIGAYLAKKLLGRGDKVIGIDNLNSYYDIQLKKDRLRHFCDHKNFVFFQTDIINRPELDKLFEEYQFNIVLHMAAQAGVRYSIENPKAYIDTNLVGFANILECCRYANVQHFVFGSSSSVYGANIEQPYSVEHRTDHPLSLYAATKKSNELMAHSYANLYRLPSTGLRFFTVYGPWGRPDMAAFKFVKNILFGKEIDIYNKGNMFRDFTYIDDIVNGVMLMLNTPAFSDKRGSNLSKVSTNQKVPYRLYNIGSSSPVNLIRFIEIIESIVNCKAKLNFLPMQAGDVMETYADISPLKQQLGFMPQFSVEEGLRKFVIWFKNYYRI